MSSRTYVVVGASTGLGRAAARVLAREHQVIVAGRDPARTRAAVPGARAALRVELRDLSDVARFSRELAAHGPLDGIVCNAGVQHTGAPAFTADGHEETFAVNHLAHFAIAVAAIPQLAPRARIAFIGSATHDPDAPGPRRFGFRGGRYTSASALARGDGDPAADERQRARDRYATSKLCNLLAMHALARRARPDRLGVFAIDPGLMPGTGLARSYPWHLRAAWHTVLRVAGAMMPHASTPGRSGAVLAWIMTSPELDGTTDRYFDFHRRELAPWAGARRDDWADELYATSLGLCGIERDPLAGALAS